eukprot:g5715.t1
MGSYGAHGGFPMLFSSPSRRNRRSSNDCGSRVLRPERVITPIRRKPEVYRGEDEEDGSSTSVDTFSLKEGNSGEGGEETKANLFVSDLELQDEIDMLDHEVKGGQGRPNEQDEWAAAGGIEVLIHRKPGQKLGMQLANQDSDGVEGAFIHSFDKGSPAEEAALSGPPEFCRGCRIVAVGKEATPSFADVKRLLLLQPERVVRLHVIPKNYACVSVRAGLHTFAWPDTGSSSNKKKGGHIGGMSKGRNSRTGSADGGGGGGGGGGTKKLHGSPSLFSSSRKRGKSLVLRGSAPVAVLDVAETGPCTRTINSSAALAQDPVVRDAKQKLLEGKYSQEDYVMVLEAAAAALGLE